MKSTLRITLASVLVASVALATTPTAQKHLTVRRIAELTNATDVPSPKAYKITISNLGSFTLSKANPQGQIENTREFIFPTGYQPPQIGGKDSSVVVVPTVPTNFDKVNAGWTIRATAKPYGKLVSVYGTIDFVEGALMGGGYGAVAGPIYTDQGDVVITPNVVDLPRFQTTTTRFHIFAVPGESYDVTIYRGITSEKHKVTVITE